MSFTRAAYLTVSALLVLLALQGCSAVGPNYQEPELSVQDTWSAKIAEQVALGPESTLQTWWTVFNDPMLNGLIERSRQQNLDLQVAVSRIRESRAYLAMVRGKELPVVDASATATETKLSDDGPFQQVAPPGGFDPQGMLQLQLDAQWEIDVFGRVRRSIESAGAQYEATVEDYRDVMVTLFAEVAIAYTELRGAQQQIRYARENVDSQRQSLKLALDRWKNGVTSKLDVAQAQANLAATQASIPLLNLSLSQALNRLSVLLGQDVPSLRQELETIGPIPQPGEAIGVGIPADILRQRPDIRRSERLLAAQTAQIGVATADLYPSFNISGFIGLQSRSLSNLFDGSSETFSLAAPIEWNIFSGGRVHSNIRIQEEKASQLLLTYRQKVLVAIEEVENAIIGFNLSRTRCEYLTEATAATTEAVDMVLDQYQNGLTDFNNVLVTQRDLHFRQDRLVATETDLVLNLIALYKALGGGWNYGEPFVPPQELLDPSRP